ncbi:MAG: hypothetical protein JST11_24220 [Acidobacteria bacterium]|nr:hypothetical protein [Acidobacteriota bacterium]
MVADDRAREMFLQEARAASMLDHPHVGTIHSIEETADGQRFIVMAYYEGETLALRLPNSCPKHVAQTGFLNRHIGTSRLQGFSSLRRGTAPPAADKLFTAKLARVVLRRVGESGVI